MGAYLIFPYRAQTSFMFHCNVTFANKQHNVCILYTAVCIFLVARYLKGVYRLTANISKFKAYESYTNRTNAS